MDPGKKTSESEFFTEYGELNRYQVSEVIGKGSYGVVAAAIDTQTGERVAIKKINDVFDHVSDATRILREIKLLRLLRHPDIVQIKHIMLPPSRREFRDIYVVFELMESDLHQVIKANDDLTPEHHQFFLYQLLRGMKYIHAASVFHRDLKPKNILANADCKLKICDFGLARVSFNDGAPSAIFWTDYVATRWYRAPELCGSFFSKYTPAIDIWSVGCIFAEMLTGKPLFPGKNVVHQLDLMTDVLGTPSAESLAKIRNEKARRYLSNMRKKPKVPLTKKFPGIDPMALHLLERLLAFDPKDRPTADEALTDPYFTGLANSEREPIAQPISKLEFEFEKRKLGKDDGERELEGQIGHHGRSPGTIIGTREEPVARRGGAGIANRWAASRGRRWRYPAFRRRSHRHRRWRRPQEQALRTQGKSRSPPRTADRRPAPHRRWARKARSTGASLAARQRHRRRRSRSSRSSSSSSTRSPAGRSVSRTAWARRGRSSPSRASLPSPSSGASRRPSSRRSWAPCSRRTAATSCGWPRRSAPTGGSSRAG
uniref:mitogen-activated protein kinase n=1 Tax=Hordeum vulgare subsp. vulgare TaxID=112509 RepID=F2ELX9_HORVV|nr:predicted protein [Hordeum vulgare subsp. vulgare]